MNAETVKVKILKNVGRYEEGSVVEIPSEEAKFVCAVRYNHTGGGNVEQFRCGVPLEEFETLQNLPKDVNELYSDEMQALGIKNIVETPKDAAFEAKLQRLGATADLPQEPEELSEAVRDLKNKAKKVTKKPE